MTGFLIHNNDRYPAHAFFVWFCPGRADERGARPRRSLTPNLRAAAVVEPARLAERIAG